MTYAEQLEERGAIKTQVAIIENLLKLGEDWSRIEAIVGVSESEFESLKQRLGELSA